MNPPSTSTPTPDEPPSQPAGERAELRHPDRVDGAVADEQQRRGHAGGVRVEQRVDGGRGDGRAAALGPVRDRREAGRPQRGLGRDRADEPDGQADHQRRADEPLPSAAHQLGQCRRGVADDPHGAVRMRGDGGPDARSRPGRPLPWSRARATGRGRAPPWSDGP